MKFFLFLIFLFHQPLFSMPHKASLKKYISSGSMIGGIVKVDSTLTHVKRLYNKKNDTERLVLSTKTTLQQKDKNKPNYYHIEVNNEKSYVLIHLDRVTKTLFNKSQIMNLLKDSPYVKTVDYYFDPINLVSTIELKLKQKVKIASAPKNLKSKQAAIIIDIKKL
jgi:hypothetical protein